MTIPIIIDSGRNPGITAVPVNEDVPKLDSPVLVANATDETPVPLSRVVVTKEKLEVVIEPVVEEDAVV